MLKYYIPLFPFLLYRRTSLEPQLRRRGGDIAIMIGAAIPEKIAASFLS